MSDQFYKVKKNTKTAARFLSIAIVDDSSRDLQFFADVIKNEAKRLLITASLQLYDNGTDFLSDAAYSDFSLVFMDICLGSENGVEVAQRLRSISPETTVIFLTVSEDYYQEAFSVHAFDYVNKENAEEQLRKTFGDLARLCWDPQPVFEVPGYEGLAIPYTEILYICTSGNYLELTASSYCRFRMTFTALKKALLPDNRFLVVSRGVLVNLEHVKKLQDDICLMDNGVSFPLIQKKARELSQAFVKWQFQKRTGELSEENPL